MSRISAIQSNFGGGELSPLIQGRVDAALYATGLKRCKNYIITEQGSLVRRPGTYYLGNTKNNGIAELVAFPISELENYQLEFGDSYIRFYQNQTLLTDSGGTPLEVATPYASSELSDIRFTQNEGVLYVVHPNHPPKTLANTITAPDILDVETVVSAAGFVAAICFGDSGTKLYVLASQYTGIPPATATVFQYTLSTAYDIATAVYASKSKTVMDGSGLGSIARATMGIKPDGTRLYVGMGAGYFITYTLSTPWDITTAVYDGVVTTLGTVNSGFYIRPDGLRLHLIEATAPNIVQYNLGTAWDITTASAAGVSSLLTGPDYVSGLHFSEDGTRLYAVTTAATVYRYSLSTAWDLTTIAYTGVTRAFGATYAQCKDILLSPDGRDLYFAVKGLGSYGPDYGVIQEHLGVAWDITSLETAWVFADFAATDGPYGYYTSGIKITVNGTSGVPTATASASLFSSTDVGRKLRLRHRIRDWTASTAYAIGDMVLNDSDKAYRCIDAGTSAGSGGPTGTGALIGDGGCIWEYVGTDRLYWGWGTIASYISSTQVTVIVGRNFGALNSYTESWQFGLWGEETGYPNDVTFHEDRIVFAQGGQWLAFSNTGNYTDMSPTEPFGSVLDTSGMALRLNSSTENTIRWMLSMEPGLLVGTSGGEWAIRASTQGEALTPTTVSAKQVTFIGSANAQAVLLNKDAAYVQKTRRKLYVEQYAQDQGTEAIHASFPAEHLTLAGIKQLRYQQSPYPILWALREDGLLLGGTYVPGATAVGWHWHELGGVGDSSGGPPVIESISVIPTPNGRSQELWMCVKRYINGATVRTIEYLTPPFDDSAVQADAYFVDCGLSYAGTATTTFAGLGHLNGETLAVLADGAVHPNVTPSGGSVTLGYAASKAHIGYAYASEGQLLRQAVATADGTSFGKERGMTYVAMLLHRTLGLEVGIDFDALDTVVHRLSSDTDGSQTPLYSGILKEPVSSDSDYDNHFCWRQSQPLPGVILAIMPQLHTEDTN